MPVNFPDVPSTTYIQDSPPAIQADDLNAFQTETIRLNRDVRGGNFLLKDDFVGATIADVWSVLGTPSQATLPDDSANEGSGTLLFLGSAGTTGVQIQTVNMSVGTKNFRFAARVRGTNPATGSMAIGFQDGTAANDFFVIIQSTGFGIKLGATITSLGVNLTSTYQLVEVIRRGGVVSVRVDGIEYFAAPNTTNCTVKNFNVTAVSGSSVLTLYTDAVWCEIERYGI
jgi:hypothetical protein